MLFRKSFLMASSFLFLEGCASEPSHLPSVFELPVVIAGSAIENTIYGARRDRVKSYVITHYEGLKEDIKKGEGAHVNALLLKVGVDKNNHQKASGQWQKDYFIMFENKELITESIMRNYSRIYIASSSKQTKTINGFSYTEASNIIKNYLKHDFEVFHSSIKNKDESGLNALISKLKIQNTENKKLFLEDILTKYDSYFIEPVVVGAMVSR